MKKLRKIGSGGRVEHWLTGDLDAERVGRDRV